MHDDPVTPDVALEGLTEQDVLVLSFAFVELGRPFCRLILNSIRQDLITLNEASGYLGNLRIRHFPKLEQRAYAG